MEIKVKKGNYFEYGNSYFVEFTYESQEQQDSMFELFENALIPSYGSHSLRSQEGKDYIMPYFADEQGRMTTENTGRIGGTSIPEDLLPEFIRRFVEVDGATVKVGDEVIKGTFDYDQFNEMVTKMGNHKTR